MTARIAVIGDALLDVDVDVTAERLVADCAAPVLDVAGRRDRAGGAALAAGLAVRDGVDVVLVTAVPDDLAGRRLQSALHTRVQLVELPCSGATPQKTRLRAGTQTVARVDECAVPTTVMAVTAAAVAALQDVDAVLVSDYGRGLVALPEVRQVLHDLARRCPVVWDPHPRGPAPVPGARAVLPNVAEAARALSTTPARTVHEASRQARELVRAWQVRSVALTRAAAGAVLAGGGGVVVVPAPVTADADACGAGDRFAAAVTAALAQGALPSEAVAAAVGAASRFVTGGGVHAYTDTDTDTGDAPRSTERHADPRALAADVRGGGGTVVATGGCFDILHPGHIATLNAARAMGDCLVVCINSDDSVRARKGPERPVQSLADRTEVLLGLAAVDGVLAFDEATPERVLAQLRPDVWVKGGDYAADELPETPLVRSWGGEVVTVPYLPERSTSRLLRKARS